MHQFAAMAQATAAAPPAWQAYAPPPAYPPPPAYTAPPTYAAPPAAYAMVLQPAHTQPVTEDTGETITDQEEAEVTARGKMRMELSH